MRCVLQGSDSENVKKKHEKAAKYGWYRYDVRFALPVYDDKTRSYQINWNDMVYLTESLVISQISMPKAV